MKAHLIDTHLLVPRSRSSAKVKVKYQSHVSQKMGVSGAIVFHKHILFTLLFVNYSDFISEATDETHSGATYEIHSDSGTTEETHSGSKKRKFQQRWLGDYPWLYHDPERNLMYCQLCRNAKKDNVLACGSDNFCTNTIT